MTKQKEDPNAIEAPITPDDVEQAKKTLRRSRNGAAVIGVAAVAFVAAVSANRAWQAHLDELAREAAVAEEADVKAGNVPPGTSVHDGMSSMRRGSAPDGRTEHAATTILETPHHIVLRVAGEADVFFRRPR